MLAHLCDGDALIGRSDLYNLGGELGVKIADIGLTSNPT